MGNSQQKEPEGYHSSRSDNSTRRSFSTIDSTYNQNYWQEETPRLRQQQWVQHGHPPAPQPPNGYAGGFYSPTFQSANVSSSTNGFCTFASPHFMTSSSALASPSTLVTSPLASPSTAYYPFSSAACTVPTSATSTAYYVPAVAPESQAYFPNVPSPSVPLLPLTQPPPPPSASPPLRLPSSVPLHSETGTASTTMQSVPSGTPTLMPQETTTVAYDFNGMTVETEEEWRQFLDMLLYTQPLLIHTQVLPYGMTPDDPRLREARVISEETYVTNYPTLPPPSYYAKVHHSLLSSPTEAQNRLVVAAPLRL